MFQLNKKISFKEQLTNESEILKLKNITKYYYISTNTLTALNNISLTVKQGEIVSIVGPSGSGKSTLLNVIGLLDYVDEGKIYIGGMDVTNLSDSQLSTLRREHIGYVFQNFNLLEELSAEKNIEMPLILAKVPKAKRKKRVAELLTAVGLQDRKEHKPSELSGGEQQRVAIARALSNDPEIILADEPTGNLDTKTGDRILQLLINLSKERDKTLIYVTHDHTQALKAERHIEMRDGKIIKDYKRL